MYRVFFLNLLPAIMAIIAMNKKYFAFISYQRKDEKIAEWLRRKLENYHLPAKIRKGNVELPKDLRPIFRDSLELSGGFLVQEIEKALSDSRFLIVVCSPNSAKSPWVNKEVQYFIENGREEYIIPFIIEGEPFSNDPEKECFPPTLKSLQGEKELLGINIAELGKDAAAVKVVARMFGLRFDTLWQGYNREQRRKRWMWSAFASIIVLVSFFISVWFYKANIEIREKQYNLLITQSRYLASEAQKEYDNGNITKAMRMALYALPKDLENPDRPYVDEAERVLRRCINVDKSKSFCRSIYKHGDDIRSCKFSTSGKFIIIHKVLSTDIIEVKSGKIIQNNNLEDAVQVAFSPDEKTIIKSNPYKKQTCVMNEIWSVYNKIDLPLVNISFNSSKDVFVGVSYNDNMAYVYNYWGHAGIPLMHDKKINSAVFSSDSKYIVTASDDSTVCIWHDAFKPVRVPHTASVEYAEFSPDNSKILTISTDSMVSVFFKTGESFRFKHPGSISSAVFSPDSRIIITTTYDRNAYLWDLEKGGFECSIGQENKINSAVFSSDGRFIITASSDSTACLYSINDLEHPVDILRHNCGVTHAAFSPCGKIVVTCTEKRTSCIWELSNEYCGTNSMKHKDEVNSIAYSPNGELIVTASDDNKACIWDATTANFVMGPLQHGTDVCSAVFSSDSKYVVTASADNTARVWDAATGKPVTEPLKHNGAVNSAVFSSDGKYVVTASYDYTARVWNARTGNAVTAPLQHGSYVESAFFSPDGKYVVTASSDSTARVWDATTGKPVTEPLQHDGFVHSAVFSPDGKYILTASFDKTARVWDATTGKPITESLLHDDHVCSAVFSLDGKYILTASFDKTARVWDVATGKPVTAPLKHDDRVYSATFGHTGKSIITTEWNGKISLWNFTDGKATKIRELQHGNGRIKAISFNHDSTFLVTGAKDGSIRVWDIINGKTLITQPFSHNLPITDIKFSSNGEYIATASRDNTARIWDASSGKPVTEPLKHGKPVIDGLFDGVESVSFSNNSKFVVTIGSDPAVNVWDVETGNLLKSLKLYIYEIARNAYFTPDDKYIVVKSTDYIYVWDWKIEKSQYDIKKKIPVGYWKDFKSYSMNKSGEYIITCSHDSIAHLWDATTAKIIKEFKVKKALFSPDDKFIITIAGNRIDFLDKQTFKTHKSLLHNDSILDVHVTSNDKYLISYLTDKTRFVWDICSYEKIAETELAVDYSAFSPCARYTLSRLDGLGLYVFDINSGKVVNEILIDEIYIYYKTFSPDGRSIYVGMDDGTVRVFPFPPLQELIDKYRNDPEHDWSLTQEEKDEYSLE